MLKRGEADVAYSLRGAFADEVKRTAGLKLAPNSPARHLLGRFYGGAVESNLPLARSARATGREPCN